MRSLRLFELHLRELIRARRSHAGHLLLQLRRLGLRRDALGEVLELLLATWYFFANRRAIGLRIGDRSDCGGSQCIACGDHSVPFSFDEGAYHLLLTTASVINRSVQPLHVLFDEKESLRIQVLLSLPYLVQEE